MKDSAQIMKETGLSRAWVNRVAQRLGVLKLGSAYVWTEEQEKILLDRMGMRGDKLSSEKATD